MIARSCLQQRIVQRCPPSQCLRQIAAQRPFQCSSFRRDREMPNHYETLELPTTASAGEIKRQFYKLSKSHHPDLHPDNPSASQKFVQISEAYATLASPEKKSRYDRDFLRANQQAAYSDHRSGSFSSASTPAGGRPASGLSRRRTQFRGPPPSFYRSGGWGQQGEKRAEHAAKASHSYEAQGQAQSGPAGPAGTGPGGFATGYDNDVPHFDQRSHYQTHSEIERTRHRARRKQQMRAEDLDFEGGNSMAFNFVVLSSVLVAIVTISGMAFAAGEKGRKKKEEPAS